jgi:N-acetylglucosamine-6-phosphate deacetylase
LFIGNSFLLDKVVAVEDGVIREITSCGRADYSCDTLTAGLVDCHTHGGYGCSVMSPTADEYAAWLNWLARHGVTGVLAGVYTASIEDMRRAIQACRDVMDAQKAGNTEGCRLLGVHLEGPFVQDARPGVGAMDTQYTQPPSVALYKEITHDCEDIVKAVTLAPELDGAGELIEFLVGNNVRVLAGHTNAAYERGEEFFLNGVSGVTHFYNAAVGLHHRNPGLILASLENENVFAEAICDMKHVHPAMLRLLIREKDAGKVIAISDAMRLAGLPEGEFEEGGVSYEIRDGACFAPDGSLAGGITTLSEQAGRLRSIGISDIDILRMVSLAPRRFLGLDEYPRVGSDADFAAFNDDMSLAFTVVRGKVYLP